MCFPACFRMTLISKGNQRKEMRLSSPTEGSLKALQIQTILAERLRGCFFALSTKSMERKPLLISSKSSASLASKYYSKEDLPQPLQTLTLQMKGHKKCILSWKKPIQGSMSSLTNTKITSWRSSLEEPSKKHSSSKSLKCSIKQEMRQANLSPSIHGQTPIQRSWLTLGERKHHQHGPDGSVRWPASDERQE